MTAVPHDLAGRTLLIRADAGSRMGTGHVMRCLALGQAWQERGGEVLFAGAGIHGALAEKVAKRGFTLARIQHPWPDSADMEEMAPLLMQHEEGGWLVLDGYHFGPEYQRALKKGGRKLLVLDDYAHLDTYEADLLVNQNISSAELSYHLPAAGQTLCGPRYALLRREFRQCGELRGESDDPRPLHILITLGGADADNVTGTVLAACKGLPDEAIEVQVVLGPANPHGRKIEEVLAGASFPCRLLRSVDNMAPLMAWADLAVTAGGSTCWELCFLGVPMLVIVVAENQLRVAEGLAAAGPAVHCGWAHELEEVRLCRDLHGLVTDRARRAAMSAAGKKLVDGLGALRVVERMVPRAISFRQAGPEDCRQIFTWANDPVIRAASFSTAPISWEEHRAWFAGKMVDEQCFFWIVMAGGEAAGQVRFELDNTVALISVSLAAMFRGLGLGSRVVAEACAKLFDETGCQAVRAKIRRENLRSIQAFERAGFVPQGEEEVNGIAALSLVLQRRDE